MSTEDEEHPVTLVLDRSAVLAYPWSIHVGEPVGEVINDGCRYGVTAVTVAEVLAMVSDPKHRKHLLELFRHRSCAVLPTSGSWLELAYWRRETSRIDLATTVMASLENNGAQILTGEGHFYGEGLPINYMPNQ